MDRIPRDRGLYLRVTQQELDDLDWAATASGLGKSHFTRLSIREAIARRIKEGVLPPREGYGSPRAPRRPRQEGGSQTDENSK